MAATGVQGAQGLGPEDRPRMADQGVPAPPLGHVHRPGAGGGLLRGVVTPIREKAKMLKRHLGGILAYFDHRITNAVAEGLNSKIKSLKSAARGFRHFENYRIRILKIRGRCGDFLVSSFVVLVGWPVGRIYSEDLVGRLFGGEGGLLEDCFV